MFESNVLPKALGAKQNIMSIMTKEALLDKYGEQTRDFLGAFLLILYFSFLYFGMFF